jgi:hypothetical protein
MARLPTASGTSRGKHIKATRTLRCCPWRPSQQTGRLGTRPPRAPFLCGRPAPSHQRCPRQTPAAATTNITRTTQLHTPATAAGHLRHARGTCCRRPPTPGPVSSNRHPNHSRQTQASQCACRGCARGMRGGRGCAEQPCPPTAVRVALLMCVKVRPGGATDGTARVCAHTHPPDRC